MIVLRNKREKVPGGADSDDGVVQKDKNGNWRIISFKPKDGPEYWNAKYSSKKKAESALRGYHASKN